MRNTKRTLAAMAAGFALMGLHTTAVAAQVDMTGDWAFEVESQNGITNPSMMLTQDGTSLTGHYSSETLGEHDVSGSVSGNTVTVDFSAVVEGLGEAPMSYSGTVDENGVWSGELVADVQGQMFPIGTFTATKQ